MCFNRNKFFCQTIMSFNFIMCHDIIVSGDNMIRENRLKKRLTQEQLAEKVDISWRQLQRIEKNEEETRVQTLKKLVKALDIPSEEIIEYLTR